MIVVIEEIDATSAQIEKPGPGPKLMATITGAAVFLPISSMGAGTM